MRLRGRRGRLGRGSGVRSVRVGGFTKAFLWIGEGAEDGTKDRKRVAVMPRALGAVQVFVNGGDQAGIRIIGPRGALFFEKALEFLYREEEQTSDDFAFVEKQQVGGVVA